LQGQFGFHEDERNGNTKHSQQHNEFNTTSVEAKRLHLNKKPEKSTIKNSNMQKHTTTAQQIGT
jgi:hypothetical protein